MRRLTMAVWVTALMGGCSTARTLTPRQSPRLAPDEGIIALRSATDGVLGLTLCPDDMRCAAAQLPTRGAVTALVVPAGRYCITAIDLGDEDDVGSLHQEPTRSARVCAVARPGVITWLGDVEFTATAMDNTAWSALRLRIQQDDEEAAPALRSAFPRLEDLEFVRATLTPREE